MHSPWMNKYLASAHREDLRREARQELLAAKATGAAGGSWGRALRLTATLLLASD